MTRSAAWIFALVLLGASGAFAHGPTIRLSLAEIKPTELVVRVGDTVHFHNANRGGGTLTVVLDGQEEVPLARGEGWHHTFEEAGEYAFLVKEVVSAKGLVRVVAE